MADARHIKNHSASERDEILQHDADYYCKPYKKLTFPRFTYARWHFKNQYIAILFYFSSWID